MGLTVLTYRVDFLEDAPASFMDDWHRNFYSIYSWCVCQMYTLHKAQGKPLINHMNEHYRQI